MMMRSCFLTNVFAYLFLLLANTALAEDARAVLDRAIKAHGGADCLERTKRAHLKAKIAVKQLDTPFEYEIEEWFDPPSHYKQILHFSNNGTPFQRELTYTGKKRWIREGTGPVREEPLTEPFPVSQHWHAFLAGLPSLREQKDRLTSLPDETKDGRTLAGIRAIYAQGKEDYFVDKSTGLVARRMITKTSLVDGQESKEETKYEDYRDIQGILYPMRCRVVTEAASSMVTLSSIDFDTKIDEKIFQKPQTPAAEGKNKETVASDTRPDTSSEEVEKPAPSRNWLLFVATLGAGIVVGTVWLIVRANKPGKQETPSI